MTRAPKLATTTFGKGSAAKQDAIRKGRVAASKAKLDALIARQAEARGPLLDADGQGWCRSCWNRQAADGFGDYCQECGEDESLSGGRAPR